MRIFWLLMLLAGAVQAQVASLPAMRAGQVSVSGLSSGAYMAVQFEVAFVYRRNLNAEHAMPTDSYGNSCQSLRSPYINYCNYGAAGELLSWIYGPLDARNTGALRGRFIAFDQSEFISLPGWHGLADFGYLYIPQACGVNAGAGCRLHVVFHGCQQNPDSIGADFVRHAGYNAWADNNRLLLLYPQTAATFTNPNACWDWFAHDDTRYAQKTGRQMAAVKRMVDRLTGATPP
ncbi:hypothetical protein [Duganella sp. BuS-21]|uniref:hypothetical protein n=1 Tax=Duganella sp. BuS-21 TaxID=2943848 RepID=UPI0035A63553